MASIMSETKLSKKSAKKKFYAVVVGRKVGVFNQWSEAQASTDKYAGACHKAFDTLDEAKTFVENHHGGDPVNAIIDNVQIHDLDNTKPSHITATPQCSECSAKDTDYMIKCSACSSWLHYECTCLPSYQLSIFRCSKRKFTCHNCADVDESIRAYMARTSKSSGTQTNVPLVVNTINTQTDTKPSVTTSSSQTSASSSSSNSNQTDTKPSVTVMTTSSSQTSASSSSSSSTQTDKKPSVMTTTSSSQTSASSQPPCSEANDATVSMVSHARCQESIRLLEQSLIDKLCGVVKENYEIKTTLIKAELETTQKDCKRLVKENQELKTINQSKNDKPTPVHQLRMDMEKAMKIRQDETKSCLATLHEELASCRSEYDQHRSNMVIKDKQYVTLQVQLQDITKQLIQTKDELYEAKRTQLAAAVDTSTFTTKTSTSSKTTPSADQARTKEKAASVGAAKTRESISSSPQRQSYASAVRSPARTPANTTKTQQDDHMAYR